MFWRGWAAMICCAAAGVAIPMSTAPVTAPTRSTITTISGSRPIHCFLTGGLAPAGVTLARDPADADDLLIGLPDGGSIRVDEMFASDRTRLERIDFDDGTTWSWQDVHAMILDQAGTGRRRCDRRLSHGRHDRRARRQRHHPRGRWRRHRPRRRWGRHPSRRLRQRRDRRRRRRRYHLRPSRQQHHPWRRRGRLGRRLLGLRHSDRRRRRRLPVRQRQ